MIAFAVLDKHIPAHVGPIWPVSVQSQVNEPSVLVQGALFIQGEGVWLHSLTSTARKGFDMILIPEGFHKDDTFLDLDHIGALFSS